MNDRDDTLSTLDEIAGAINAGAEAIRELPDEKLLEACGRLDTEYSELRADGGPQSNHDRVKLLSVTKRLNVAESEAMERGLSPDDIPETTRERVGGSGSSVDCGRLDDCDCDGGGGV